MFFNKVAIKQSNKPLQNTPALQQGITLKHREQNFLENSVLTALTVNYIQADTKLPR